MISLKESLCIKIYGPWFYGAYEDDSSDVGFDCYEILIFYLTKCVPQIKTFYRKCLVIMMHGIQWATFRFHTYE